MKRYPMWMLVATTFCGLVLLGQARADDKPDGPPPKRDGGPAGDGPGGRGGPRGGPGGPPPGGIHLIPRFAAEKLNLSDDQKKQIGELEKDCKEKLAKILTPEQMKTLEEARPPRGGPGGRGPGPDGAGPGEGRRAPRPDGAGPGGGRGPGDGPARGPGGPDADGQPPRPPRQN